MTPLRVLTVSHACVIDENQRLFAELGSQPDLEVGLVAPARWKTDLRGRQAFAALPGFPGPVFPLRPVFNGRGTLHFYPAAARAVRAFRPDVIHLDEEPWSLAAWQFAELGARRRARVFFHTKENLPKRYPFPFPAIERRVFTLSAGALAMTREAEDVLRGKGFTKPVVTVPHVIDPAQFHPREESELRRAVGVEGTVVGYLGRLSVEKGVLDLIEALGRLAGQCRLGNATALMIGSGPLEAELPRRAAALGLGGRLRLLPALPHRDVAPYYGCADIVVVPSRTVPRWKEQFGRVLIEAWASGCAVIGSDSGQIPHLIRETGGGLIVPEGDVPALGEALHGLLRDPEARRRYAAQGRAAILDAYTPGPVARRVRDVYRGRESPRCVPR